MARKNIALVGGAGFIGHNLALRLHELGHSVHVVDGLEVNNLLAFASNPQRDPATEFYWNILKERIDLLNAAGIPLHVEDARDYHRLTMTLSKIKPDVIVLLAAVSHANKSNKDPHKTFDHSLRTLENALDHCRGAGVEHFIYLSSSMVYGNFNDQAVTEDTTCSPMGIYGALKFAGEKVVQAYNQVFGIPYTILRPSALYGQRCVSRRVGQIFLENALTGREITIAGDGSDKLDFTYIKDLVEGIVRVIDVKESRNQTFNMTYGSGRSIADMAKLVLEHFPNLKIRYEKKDSLTPDRGTLNVEKAKTLIGYQPKYPLEIGYVEYIQWYKEFWARAARWHQ